MSAIICDERNAVLVLDIFVNWQVWSKPKVGDFKGENNYYTR